MRRTSVFLLLIMFGISISAQTQQGIVKTRGRMVNGQLVPGTRLSGATITLNFGNPLISSNQGTFSFVVPPAKSFSLVNATKQGYTLADPEYTRRFFSYSSKSPFYVVLEDENQRQADINAATRKVRKTLQTQLDKREEEIEELKAQNKLTEKEYENRLQHLYDNHSKSEQLIKEMAERYASTDYDQLDEFNQKVQQYIEDGELQKADSMIRSKGNMEQRVAEYHDAVAANNKVRKELEQSESGTAKTYEDLSLDLLRQSEIYLQQFQQDSALCYLKMRADLDTTHLDAVFDYAELCLRQRIFVDSKKYFLICLRLSLRANNMKEISDAQNNLGIFYDAIHDYVNSKKYYMLALENYEQLLKQDSYAYLADLARTQNNVGSLFIHLQDYLNSEKYYKLALENLEQLFCKNPNVYLATLSTTQNNLGALYTILQDYSNGEKYLMLALENYKQLFKEYPKIYRADLAMTQGNLGLLYEDHKDYLNSEKYYKLALENYEQLFRDNQNAYCVGLTKTQYNLGNLYCKLQDYTNSEKYLKLALENYEQLFRDNQNVYCAGLAKTQNNLGLLYADLQDYSNSEKYLMLALENYAQLFKENPDAYRADFAGTMYSLMLIYAADEKINLYCKYLEKTLDLYMELYKLTPDMYASDIIALQNRKVWLMLSNENVDAAIKLAENTYAMDNSQEQSKVYLAKCYNSKAYEYAKVSKYSSAHSCVDKALALMPSEANFYDSKGEFYLMQGKNEEALEMWKKVLELNPNFLDNYPDGSNLSNGLKKLGLIK